MKKQRQLLGYCGVDSGQILLTDPCYISEFIDNEFDNKSQFIDVKTKKIINRPEDFYNFEDDKIPGYDKNMNTLIKEGIFKELDRDLDSSYSYNGACHQTCFQKNQGGELGNGMGVAVSSGWGDGSYPVYANYDEDGRVSSVTIKF
jgi:hypothetical protein|tara:strand:+ start:176 stop:613 length:438 start_codon:yes stop_codon:yes gene_type:complete